MRTFPLNRLLALLVLGAVLAGCASDEPDFVGTIVVPPGETASLLIEAPGGDHVRWSSSTPKLQPAWGTQTDNATCTVFFDANSSARDFHCSHGGFQGLEKMVLELRWTNSGTSTALVRYQVWTDGEVFT